VKYLARPEAQAVLVCGCGGQAIAQLRAILAVRKVQRVYAYDRDARKAQAFAALVTGESGITIEVTADLRKARECAIIVTCTTARRYFLLRDMVSPGTFVAAIWADHEDKQEIDPDLMAHATVVTDLTSQARLIGDLHHALTAGKMAIGDVHAELGEVVAGKKCGRTSDDEIVVFDSTGTGLQDVAAAITTYRQALDAHAGTPFTFC
jgi:ornithine cyclodeaminase/alanine dehydrogenase-like protein (mu-crystallin family)